MLGNIIATVFVLMFSYVLAFGFYIAGKVLHSLFKYIVKVFKERIIK